MATYGFLCPTPKASCKGSLAKLNGSLDKQGLKKHGTQKEAMDCYCQYLINQGYKRISAREFRKEGEPIMFLSKVSRFGARLRSGKRGDSGGSGGGNRGNPVKTGGVIVCT